MRHYHEGDRMDLNTEYRPKRGRDYFRAKNGHIYHWPVIEVASDPVRGPWCQMTFVSFPVNGRVRVSGLTGEEMFDFKFWRFPVDNWLDISEKRPSAGELCRVLFLSGFIASGEWDQFLKVFLLKGIRSLPFDIHGPVTHWKPLLTKK